MSQDAFLVALCPSCGIPWPTYSRTDLRLVDHSARAIPHGFWLQVNREWEELGLRTDEAAEARRQQILNDCALLRGRCAGSGRVLPGEAYGENGDPRFTPALLSKT